MLNTNLDRLLVIHMMLPCPCVHNNLLSVKIK